MKTKLLLTIIIGISIIVFSNLLINKVDITKSNETELKQLDTNSENNFMSKDNQIENTPTEGIEIEVKENTKKLEKVLAVEIEKNTVKNPIKEMGHDNVEEWRETQKLENLNNKK